MSADFSYGGKGDFSGVPKESAFIRAIRGSVELPQMRGAEQLTADYADYAD
jgi:hypothetical protein